MSRKKIERKKTDIISKLEINSNGKYVLQLIKPIKIKDEVIKELELDEPKAKHIRNMPSDPIVDDVLKICADLASQPDHVIDELCMKDVAQLTDFFESFA